MPNGNIGALNEDIVNMRPQVRKNVLLPRRCTSVTRVKVKKVKVNKLHFEVVPNHRIRVAQRDKEYLIFLNFNINRSTKRAGMCWKSVGMKVAG